MTYKELLEELKKMSDEQLNLSVCFHDENCDEYYPAVIDIADEDTSENHLGAGPGIPHPVIVYGSAIPTINA